MRLTALRSRFTTTRTQSCYRHAGDPEAAGRRRQPNANVVTDGKGTESTADDTYSLGALAISGGEVSVGDILVTDIRSIADADGLVTAKGDRQGAWRCLRSPIGCQPLAPALF